jgi:hypothetical protein
MGNQLYGDIACPGHSFTRAGHKKAAAQLAAASQKVWPFKALKTLEFS